uniref:Uncharacterized protein n=1 Tax=Knipowitschia caucasica TaxID=637954 RepID=A0AAV2LIM4_KNICA
MRTCHETPARPISVMTESAEAVAAALSSRRSVTIEITNLSGNYCLINPKVYLEKGSIPVPPQPTVRPLKTEKRHDFIETVAIMFSVPYDGNMYKNWFALGIYPKGTECNEALYKKMYYDKEPQGFVRMEAVGSGITFEGSYLDVKTTMSPLGRAIMKVEIWDKLFSAPGQQQKY